MVTQTTAIEWTDRTWNILRGCQWVSKECWHCYAMNIAYRFSGKGQPYEGLAHKTENGIRWTGKIKLVYDLLKEPFKWKKPQRVFVNSMSDLFHDDVPFEFIYKVFNVMLQTPQHTYQILTKRPERMVKIIPDIYLHLRRNYRPIGLPLANVWLGVSAGTQEAVDKRVPLLLQTAAIVRFVSCEPLLEKLDLKLAYPDWIIVGAESGHGARPMDEDWVRSLQQQAEINGAKFFYKQQFDGRKKISLPLLDGKRWAEMPMEAR